MTEQAKTGRPPYAPTDEDRTKARVLKATGMANEAIAEALGISEPTLRKHLSLELQIGAATVLAEVMMARYAAAMAGNVQAQNKMIELVGTVPTRAMAKTKARQLGKKEQQQAEAETGHTGSDWGSLLQ